MRVSELYGLTGGQAALDFVDVDVSADVRLFVDPYPIRKRTDEWSRGCIGLLQDFFATVLDTVKVQNRDAGIRLLAGLSEPNETHLGYSSRASRGSGIGVRIASELWDALDQSGAASSGLITDLEESALLVEGVSIDRVSDICINVMRRPLFEYTQQQATLHDIPLKSVRSGRLWDPAMHEWADEEFVDLPVGPSGPLLLVPKSIVRQRLTLDPGQYYTHYILPRFRDDEISAGRGLVRVLKDGREVPYLPKKVAGDRLLKRTDTRKRANLALTEEDRGLLRDYLRDVKRGLRDRPAVDLDQLPGDGPNWPGLLSAVVDLPAGPSTASTYHRAVRDLVTALFYPDLDGVVLEQEIEQGRKRADLRYTNHALSGFFLWLQSNYPPQPYVWCECKNYSDDPGNEELDQLTGRFAAQGRGSFGFLVCRKFRDRGRFVQRAREAQMAGRGFVLPLDDNDLRQLVAYRIADDTAAIRTYLTDLFGQIVS